MKKFLIILLLLVTTFIWGKNETPSAIQTLQNAGMTVWSIGDGKWKTNTNDGRVKILNDDGSVFLDCLGFKFYSEGRYAFFQTMTTTYSSVKYTVETKVDGTTYYTEKSNPESVSTSDWDIIDEKGQSILKFPIDGTSGWGYINGKCAVKIGKLWGFIDRDGNLLCEPKFAHADLIQGKYGTISDEFGSNVGIINDQYEIIIPVTSQLFNVRRIKVNGEYVIYTDGKNGHHYEVEKLVDLYNFNGRNLNKTLKAYQKLYATTLPH